VIVLLFKSVWTELALHPQSAQADSTDADTDVKGKQYHLRPRDCLHLRAVLPDS
jgi:hypothetical protein